MNFEHGGEIHCIARELGVQASDLVDFSSSINPLGPPASVQRAMAQAADRIAPYPDSSSQRLRDAIARRWNLDAQSILVGNGSTELLFLAARAFRPKATAIVGPTFSEYERAARLVGSDVRHIMMDVDKGFQWNPTAQNWDTLLKSQMCYICNPNNPSGTVFSKKFLMEIVRRFPRTLFVLDEAFVDFIGDPICLSLMAEAAKVDNLIVLRSFTKFYAIAGLRLGFAVASPGIIRCLEKFKEPWSVNSLAQTVGERMLDEIAFEQRTRRWLPEEREWLRSQLVGLPEISCFHSEANYLLLKILSSRLDARDLFQKLLPFRIVIRDASNFHGLDARFIRVAVKTREQNTLLLEALTHVFVLVPAQARSKSPSARTGLARGVR